jgi:hypothetical protein
MQETICSAAVCASELFGALQHVACDSGLELMLRAIPLALCQGSDLWQRAAMAPSSPVSDSLSHARSGSPLQHVLFKRNVTLVRRLEIPDRQQHASGNKRRSSKQKEEVVPSEVFAYVDHYVR